MKFAVDMTINKDRSSVWKAFDNPSNIKRWMPTLQSFEPQAGTPGQVGSIAKLTYREDGRSLTMVERITRREEPDNFAGVYTAQGVINRITNTFVEVNPIQTRWTLETEYKFSGILALVAPLMKNTFVKRTQADMERFKAMVESQ